MKQPFRRPRSEPESDGSSTHAGTDPIDVGAATAQWLADGARAGCNVCGKVGAISIGAEERAVDHPSVLRESLVCRSCGSISRDRALLTMLAAVLGESGPLSHWSPRKTMRLMETSGYRGHPPLLADVFDYYNLPYVPAPDGQSGKPVDARRGGDLQDLQFPAEFFDVVMTAEVLEHVPDEQLAIKEIARVLAPGGHLLLEVPYDHQSERTSTLVHRWHGRDVYLYAPQYHAEETLVYRIYGRQLLAQLADAGLTVGHLFMDIPQLAISPQPVILARKAPYLDLAGFRLSSWFPPSA